MNKDKKLAICLFGLSKEKYRHWGYDDRWKTKSQYPIFDINWKHSLDNYKEYLFDYFKNQGYSIDIYFCTHDNNMSEDDKKELINTYNPIDYSFINIGNICANISSKNRKINKVIDLCLNSKKEYDHILITRFDLHFKKSFNDHKLDFNLFNIISELQCSKVICDNFYFFPFKLLPNFKNALDKIGNKSYHYLKPFIEEFSKIHYVYNEYTDITSLTFYTIVRIESTDPDPLPKDFDWKVYRAIHPDLKRMGRWSIVNHYLDHGMKAGRKYKFCDVLPSDFNVTTYKSLHHDIAIFSDYDATIHYLNCGKKEGRRYK
jgi:hypothetical protein